MPPSLTIVMKRLPCAACTLAILAAPLAAFAQSAGQETPQPPAAPSPDSPKMRRPPASGDRGAVVVPPRTDPAAVATPPRNVDPDINAANKQGDKKAHKQSRRAKKHR